MRVVTAWKKPTEDQKLFQRDQAVEKYRDVIQSYSYSDEVFASFPDLDFQILT